MTINRRRALSSKLPNQSRHKTGAMLLGSLMGAALCVSPSVFAQTTPATPSAQTPAKKDNKAAISAATPAPSEVVTVTIEATRPTNRIDRQVYDVKSDISSTNGSAADALKNVPSVTVDPDGAVTLRGSSNVQILVDGKPSAMLQGDNRGAALNAMPADDIESVEVINNPGAQFGNEGGGPILNFVMKRNRRPGGFGIINTNVGSNGRYNSALSGSYNEGKFGFQGGINYRHDGRNVTTDVSRQTTDAAGVVTPSSQHSRSVGLNDFANANAALTYNLTDKDTLGASLSYFTRTNNQNSNDHYLNFGATTADDYVRTTQRHGDSENASWGARWDHKGDITGETLKIDLRVSSSNNSSDSASNNVYATKNAFDADHNSRQTNATKNKLVDFTGDYERPTEKGIVKLGYKIYTNDNTFDNTYSDFDASHALIARSARNNLFTLDETDLALYGSYQLRLNEKWGVLGGVRVEKTSIDLDSLDRTPSKVVPSLPTSDLSASNSYYNTIPSFYVSYKESDDTNIRFSYSHRIRRPGANDLNPFVVYRDEFNVSSGNPKLKPTQTDSVELGYETKWGTIDTNLRGYYRKDSDTISDHSEALANGVTLTTRDNAGSSQSGGLEFSLSGKVAPKWTMHTSGNLAYFEQNSFSGTSGVTQRTASSLSLRGRVTYQATDADQIQVSANAQGKTLSGQGYRSPSSTMNLSYRHTVTPSLNLVMNVTDIFNSNKNQTVIDTDGLRETSTRRFDGQVAYIGFSYRFGGPTPASKKDMQDGQYERGGRGMRGGNNGGQGGGD